MSEDFDDDPAATTPRNPKCRACGGRGYRVEPCEGSYTRSGPCDACAKWAKRKARGASVKSPARRDGARRLVVTHETLGPDGIRVVTGNRKWSQFWIQYAGPKDPSGERKRVMKAIRAAIRFAIERDRRAR